MPERDLACRSALTACYFPSLCRLSSLGFRYWSVTEVSRDTSSKPSLMTQHSGLGINQRTRDEKEGNNLKTESVSKEKAKMHTR